jgi:predicted hydrolase (HD superfamily)
MENRDQSIQLLQTYIEGESLLNHSKMVALAMGAYAKHLDKSDSEIEEWWAAGLLHDLDWEKYPDEHPKKAINDILSKYNYSVNGNEYSGIMLMKFGILLTDFYGENKVTGDYYSKLFVVKRI